MASVKKSGGKKYIAVAGIDFPKQRVEPGEPIPSDIEASEIAELLEIGAIKEAE